MDDGVSGECSPRDLAATGPLSPRNRPATCGSAPRDFATGAVAVAASGAVDSNQCLFSKKKAEPIVEFPVTLGMVQTNYDMPNLPGSGNVMCHPTAQAAILWTSSDVSDLYTNGDPERNPKKDASVGQRNLALDLAATAPLAPPFLETLHPALMGHGVILGMAVSGVAFAWKLARTTAVGTGGTAQTAGLPDPFAQPRIGCTAGFRGRSADRT